MIFAAEAVFLYHAKIHIKENNTKIVGYFFCRVPELFYFCRKIAAVFEN